MQVGEKILITLEFRQIGFVSYHISREKVPEGKRGGECKTLSGLPKHKIVGLNSNDS